MPVHNSDIAGLFNQIADLLEIKGENLFRVRAYRNAARTVGDMPRSAADMLRDGEDLSELPGIGKDLAAKIREIVQTGTVGLLNELKGELPGELGSLLEISGLGPKRVHELYKKLGITTLTQLEQEAKEGKVSALAGFGVKTEEKILVELGRISREQTRTLLPVADEIAGSLVDYLKQFRGVKAVEAAGSCRRRKETVGDLDILAVSSKSAGLMEHFVKYDDVSEIISKGDTRSSVRLRSGLQVDLRVVPEVSFGAALHYFTGSKAHNIAVRALAVKKGLKINEYGVFRSGKRIAGRTEEEVYRQVGLVYIEPELREDRGELEAARQGRLPKLVSSNDIRGDLHAHTTLTDGRFSLEAMAEAARARGYEYLAITEHSRRVTVARGIGPEGLGRQIREIEKLNGKLKNFVLLKGIEVDILEDGSLDLPDDILRELDVVVCSVHYKFNLSRQKQTERIVRAMDNPYFNILAHPSGRLLNERPPYDMDMERVIRAALERGCFLEVNAHPQRLDLTDLHCKEAKEAGVKMAISTDAHSTGNLDYMRLGVGQARRGWLEAKDIINTRNLEELRKMLRRR